MAARGPVAKNSRFVEVRATRRPAWNTTRSVGDSATAWPTDAARMASSSAGAPGTMSTSDSPKHMTSTGADGRVPGLGCVMTREDQQRGRFEWIGSPHQVERILQVVAAGGHRHPGRAQRSQRCESSRDRDLVRPALQIEIRLG